MERKATLELQQLIGTSFVDYHKSFRAGWPAEVTILPIEKPFFQGVLCVERLSLHGHFEVCSLPPKPFQSSLCSRAVLGC